MLIGCGNMGSALLESWQRKLPGCHDIVVVEPEVEAFRIKFPDSALTHCTSVRDIEPGLPAATVVFAVKPQVLDDVVSRCSHFVDANTVVLSIVAGKTIGGIRRFTGDLPAVVRAMPNTPAAIGRGITAAVSDRPISEHQENTVAALLDAVGETVWLEDEASIDAVTAVSGSGPAYVFLLAETLARAGVSEGLSDAVAHKLALATISGAGELARLSHDSPAALRRAVTSPGGTTEAAMKVLMAKSGLQKLITEAVGMAAKRSRELAD